MQAMHPDFGVFFLSKTPICAGLVLSFEHSQNCLDKSRRIDTNNFHIKPPTIIFFVAIYEKKRLRVTRIIGITAEVEENLLRCCYPSR